MNFLKWWWKTYNVRDDALAMIIKLIVIGGPFAMYLALALLETHVFGTYILMALPIVLGYGAVLSFGIYVFIGKLKEIRRRYNRESER